MVRFLLGIAEFFGKVIGVVIVGIMLVASLAALVVALLGGLVIGLPIIIVMSAYYYVLGTAAQMKMLKDLEEYTAKAKEAVKKARDA